MTTMVVNPSHSPLGEEAPKKYKERIMKALGKRWLEPTELLMEIARITGGYYYAIGEGENLEEVLLTEAFSMLGRRLS